MIQDRSPRRTALLAATLFLFGATDVLKGLLRSLSTGDGGRSLSDGRDIVVGDGRCGLLRTIFLIPWVLVFREFLAAQLPILLPIFFFLFVLVLGLIYELKKGAIEWEK